MKFCAWSTKELASAAIFMAAALGCGAGNSDAQSHRQLGAHEHGHGRLNIAIDGKTLSMELEVPGADIVGFEHDANTEEQKAAADGAKARLANGLSLFQPDPVAGCILKSSKIEVEAENEGGEPARDHAAGRGEEARRHSSFHVEYAFECASISRLSSMAFDYFKVFPRAQVLDVTLLSAKGQASYKVTRDKPVLDFAGIM